MKVVALLLVSVCFFGFSEASNHFCYDIKLVKGNHCDKPQPVQQYRLVPGNPGTPGTPGTKGPQGPRGDPGRSCDENACPVLTREEFNAAKAEVAAVKARILKCLA
eukprot:290207_1